MSKSISDLFRRSQKAKAIAEDQSMKKWQQAAQTFQSFSELELTGLPQDVRTDLEADFIALNRILAKYPIQTTENKDLWCFFFFQVS
jgi:hypothetical protein